MDKSTLLKYSKEVGIDIVSVTDSKPLDRIEDYLIYRKESGIITEFEESQIKKRIDPKEIMKNCKSVIVVGISYNVDYCRDSTIKVKGSLSKSSWGEDYHRVLMRKMEGLVERISQDEEMNYLIFSDTGPLVDRELAFKSGIGYYGKNCSIINDRLGSFIFLGYILTDMYIQRDTGNFISKCGECRLCIDACPTGALTEYKLDAKKCISYLTQTKDTISEELAGKMGIKIYGCDTCQMVCPKNKGVEKNLNSQFLPVKTGGVIDIEELILMSKSEFRLKYGSMSGSWRGKTILIRNSLIALINMNQKEHHYLIQEVKKKRIPLLEEYIIRWENRLRKRNSSLND